MNKISVLNRRKKPFEEVGVVNVNREKKMENFKNIV